MTDQNKDHRKNAANGLGNGRNWGALPLRQEQYQWSMEANGPPVQGPLDMEFLRGQRMLLTLETDQFGLLIRNDSLKALYLDGCHHLDIGNSQGQIQTDSHLYFISTGKSMEFRWNSNNDSCFTTDDGTKIIGQCSVRIEKPARFYHRILRPLSNCSPEALQRHLEPMVQIAFHNLLDQVSQMSWEHAGGLQSSLMDLGPSQLDEFLAEHGLFCDSLAAYTAAPPIENWQDQTSGQSSDLLHN